MKNLTEGNIYKTFILFAIPLVISALLTHAYHITDTIIAGKFLGADGIAAIGATSSYITILTCCFGGFSAGFSVYAGMLFGARKFYRLKVTILSNFIVLSSMVITISLLTILFTDKIFDFLRIDDSIRKDAYIYFVIVISGHIFNSLNLFGLVSMNALGMSEFPLRVSLVSTAVNLTGNFLSVAVLNFGVCGLAISTVLATVIGNVMYFVRLKKCFAEMETGRLPLTFSLTCVKKTLSFSLPNTFQQIMLTIASFLLTPIINGIGSVATAAYAIVIQIHDINTSIYVSSAKTLANYTAQCVGAGKFDKIKKGVRVGLIQNILLVLPTLVLCVVFAEELCRLFFPKGYTGEALGFSVAYARYFLPFAFLDLINNLFHGFFRAIKNMGILIISTSIGAVSRLIASLILAEQYGIYGIYAGWVISWFVEAIFALTVYLGGFWKIKSEGISPR